MATCILSGNHVTLTQKHLANDEIRNGMLNSKLTTFIGITDNTSNLQFECVDEGIQRNTFSLCATSAVDAIYRFKTQMDRAEILNCDIYVPNDEVVRCTLIKQLLFIDAFDVRVRPFPVAVLVPWYRTNEELRDCQKEVANYLTSVPSQGKIKVNRSKLIPPDTFLHGYTTRMGGISTHPALTSLNMTYSSKKPDSPLVAKENRRRLCRHENLDPDKYNLARVEHGNKIWVYEKEVPGEKYDGIVTNTPGVTIAAPGADCMMVLLADPVKKACGAVHAGFAGVLAEALKAAIIAMAKEYGSDPGNIIGTVGPCLNVCCADYKRDPAGFLTNYERSVCWKDGVPHINLRLAARIQLESSGVKSENIDDGIEGPNRTPELAACTKCDPNNDYFSHRRDGLTFGNCVGFISLKPDNLCYHSKM